MGTVPLGRLMTRHRRATISALFRRRSEVTLEPEVRTSVLLRCRPSWRVQPQKHWCQCPSSSPSLVASTTAEALGSRDSLRTVWSVSLSCTQTRDLCKSHFLYMRRSSLRDGLNYHLKGGAEVRRLRLHFYDYSRTSREGAGVDLYRKSVSSLLYGSVIS